MSFPESATNSIATQRADHGPPRTDAELAAALKALGHPVRLAIVRHLAAMQGCVCGEIVSIFDLAQSTVSQHLRILKDAGLVRGEVQGPRTCYCLDREALARTEQALKRLVAGAVPVIEPDETMIPDHMNELPSEERDEA